MSAGALRERLRFERRIAGGDDGYGNTQMNWAPVTTMAARINPASGDERVLASKLQGVQLFEITVRWCKASQGIKPSDRAVDTRTNEIYNIRSAANDDEHRREIVMLASQGDAHG